MEGQQKKKPTLKFYQITSNKTRKEIIAFLNEKLKVEGDRIIPEEETKVTFWENIDDGKLGLTFTNEKVKWGIRYFNGKWYPASYMAELGYKNFTFSDDENTYFTDMAKDNCKNFK